MLSGISICNIKSAITFTMLESKRKTQKVGIFAENVLVGNSDAPNVVLVVYCTL